ncbi:MAG TPA: hypothetical protein PK990_04230 [Salinivirgaceae bacterium]|nr:hypothetical protein [Salinivirgaceae bacterium]
MKAVLIIHNKAVSEQVLYILEKLDIKGFTKWDTVYGQGYQGEPRMGTHTWPEENSAVICIINDSMVEPLKNAVSYLDNANTDVGVKAFIWEANYLF